MKKNLFLTFLALVAFLVSCSKDNQPTDCMVDVTVSLNGLDITITPEDAKSGNDAQAAGVKRIALSVYDLSGNLIADTIQNKDVDATGFGNPITMRLPVGSYKFVAVAHTVASSADPVATINSASSVSFGSAIVGNPTYTTVQDVTITGNTTQAIQIDMGTRKNATFVVKFADANPDAVAKLQFIISPNSTAYSDLVVNPSTGLTATQWKYEKYFVFANLPGFTTTQGKIFALPLMLTAANQQLDVTINALSTTDAVLYTRTLSNVPFQQAHKTLATGTFFSPDATSTFTFNLTETIDTISLD